METVTVNRPLAWLTAQHERLLGIVDGLTEEQMRTAVLPSGWTPVGMLVHVREATRFWLAEIMLGDHPTEQFTDEVLPGDSADEPFRIPDEVPIAEVTARFRTITHSAVAGVVNLSADTQPAWWPQGAWGGWRLDDLGEVLLHLLVETACHAGHLDAARELTDGGTWDYEHRTVLGPNE